MLEVAYYDSRPELLIDGHWQDFERLVLQTRELFAAADEHKTVNLPVTSTGETPVVRIVVRKGSSPNRVSYESGQVVFSVAPTLLEQFLSFMDFSGCDHLLDSPVGIHSHYEYIGQDHYIASDSLPVVFGLKRREHNNAA